MAPVLPPRTCEHLTSHGDRLGSCDEDLKMGEIILDYSGGPNVITRFLIRGRQGIRVKERR